MKLRDNYDDMLFKKRSFEWYSEKPLEKLNLVMTQWQLDMQYIYILMEKVKLL